MFVKKLNKIDLAIVGIRNISFYGGKITSQIRGAIQFTIVGHILDSILNF